MFDHLTTRLSGIIEQLRGRAALSERDIDAALREIRVALLEADVALPAVRRLLDRVRELAVGQEVLRSVTPGQMVVKIVHDQIVEALGGAATEFSVQAPPPAAILLVGLQGAGKTTTAGKLGYWLRTTHKKNILAVSLDFARPAAQKQLQLLCEQAGIGFLPAIFGENPQGISKRAMRTAAKEGFDFVLLDSAGRTSIAETRMDEIAAVAQSVKPAETLLVADAMTGQDALTTAANFAEKIQLSGLVLTRADGDARGGAALSMRSVTQCPIKLLGTGEKLDALEQFDPKRIAGRILGMGDVVGLVERVSATVDHEEAETMARKMRTGQFDLNDLAGQLRQMRRMGGMKGLLGMLPGAVKMQKQMQSAQVDERMLGRQEAIIMAMTPWERRNADALNASRKRRIAKGSGTQVQEINRLLKQHKQMRDMIKRAGKLSRKGGNPAAMLNGMLSGRR